jgi:hypothetical protein
MMPIGIEPPPMLTISPSAIAKHIRDFAEDGHIAPDGVEDRHDTRCLMSICKIPAKTLCLTLGKKVSNRRHADSHDTSPQVIPSRNPALPLAHAGVWRHAGADAGVVGAVSRGHR